MTRRVTYQSILAPTDADATDAEGRFERLGDAAIRTRRKDAHHDITAAFSKDQARWLAEVCEQAGSGIDEAAVLRAMVDLGRELDVDWSAIDGGSALRAAVRASVKVRRRTRD